MSDSEPVQTDDADELTADATPESDERDEFDPGLLIEAELSSTADEVL